MMAPHKEYVLVDPDGPCPCRSGKITAECCMAPDGSFIVRYPSPLPPGNPTGFSHANCYMRDSLDCSTDIAAGYYFSNAVRDLLRAKVVCANFPWDDPGREVAVRSDELPSAILCHRHNDALASLDAVALQAFRNILDAIAYVTTNSLTTKKTLCALSGEGLELWTLKLLFGAYHARMAAGDSDVLQSAQLPEIGIFQRALESGDLAPPCGLYIRRSQADSDKKESPSVKTHRITSLCFLIGPLECELIVDPTGLNFDVMRSQNFYRPSGIDLVGKKRSAQIHMSGAGFASNELARLALSETRSRE